ncbi:MAG: VOC family protein [Gammaproteobacteria bacterium]|nr:VOC family protein [Gammaproteobacteria bacterium]MDH4253496.1 VOC family protein [Gammaproteobacteria bacterium]MDH5309729.1 VOC family protein [Gammaproteobacteria bacterium]
MHKSRFSGFIIDCNGDDLDGAAAFWSAALGMPTVASLRPEDRGYVLLDSGERDLDVEVQQVTHASGVHLDIETDAVETEVRRLEGLGASRVRKVRDWYVMQSPTGQRFCVVPARDPGGAGWNEWV